MGTSWQDEYQRAVDSGKPPRQYVTNSKGQQFSNKAYEEYQRYVQQQQKIAAAKKAFEASGFKTESTGPLSRTASDILQGKSNAKLDQVDSSVLRQVKLTRLNRSISRGEISPSQYYSELSSLNQSVARKAKEESDQRARTSTKRAQANSIKQREQRETAALHGVAVGTISDGKASVSNNSVIANNVAVNNFVESQKVKPVQTKRDGTTDNPIQSEQPDQSLVSPILKQNMEKNKVQKIQETKSTQKESKISKVSLESNQELLGFTGFNQYLVQENPQTISQEQEFVGPTKPQKEYPLDQVSKWFEDVTAKSNNPIVDFFGGIGKETVANLSGLVNLETKAGEYFHSFITGNRHGSVQEHKVSETPTGIITSGLGQGVISSYEKGDINELFKSGNKSFAKAYTLAQAQGLPETLGQTVAIVAPFNKNPIKALPIRGGSFKALTIDGPKTIIRQVDVGYGSKTKPVLTLSDAGLKTGGYEKVIAKTTLSKIEAVDRGLEFSTAGKLGTEILTSDIGLDILKKAGKLSNRDVEAVILGKELATIFQKSAKVVSNPIRQKASILPEKPTTSIRSGKESDVLKDELLPKSPTIKGTLSETVQLDTDLVRTPKEIREILKIGKSKDALSNLGELKAKRNSLIRSDTTEDIDIDFGHLPLGTYRGKKFGDMAIKKLSKTSDKDREWYKKGTNVFVKTKGEAEDKELFNILTKRDAKGGYLNPISKPFEINLKKRNVKIPSKEGGKKTEFVSIEQNAMNRIESMLSLQGPKSDKFKGDPNNIPYLKAPIQKTESGYFIGTTEHRFKDMSKLISQDTEQIARNLIKSGYEKEGTRAREIAKRYQELYPEVDFKNFDYPKEFGTISYPSKLSKGVDVSKQFIPTISKEFFKGENKKQESKNQSKYDTMSVSSFTKNRLKRIESSAYLNPSKSAYRAVYGKSVTKRLDSSLGLYKKPSYLTNSKGNSKGKSTGSKGNSKGSIDNSLSKFNGSSGSTGSTGSTGSLGSRGSAASLGSAAARDDKPLFPFKRIVMPFGLVPGKDATKKTIGKKKPGSTFLGNTQISSITGMAKWYKKQDIKVGIKKTAKLYKSTLKEEKKKRDKRYEDTLSNLLGKKTKGKKKSKRKFSLM